MRRTRPGGTAILVWATGSVVVAAALVAVFAITSAWPTQESTVEVSPARTATTSATPRVTPLAPLHVVGLGDSVMAGTNCNCENIMTGFAHALADRTGRDVTASNLGVSGYTTSDLLDQLHQDATARREVAKADILIVIIGANDFADALDSWNQGDCDASCYQPQVDAMGTRLAAVLTLARSLRAGQPMTVLVDNYWNVFTDGDVARADGGQERIDWSGEVTTAANRAIAKAASGSGDLTVDLVRPFKSGGDKDPTPLLADDGDHPNAAGARAIVAANIAAIRA
ncbi:MAG: SGNH/GDSL hydrolase family protein [Propionicimonas sp.]